MSGKKLRKSRLRHAAREIVPSTPVERAKNGGFAPGNQLALGNTGARKRRFLTQQLISRLQDTDPKDPTKRRAYEVLVDNLVKRALRDSDMDAIKFIFERVEGKLLQPAETNDVSGMTFTLKIGHRSPDGDETVIEARREKDSGKRVDPDIITDQDRRDFGET